MADPDPTQQKFETAIAAAAPLLDLVLAVGERISRVAEPVDYEYYPVRGEEGDAEDGEEPAERQQAEGRAGL